MKAEEMTFPLQSNLERNAQKRSSLTPVEMALGSVPPIESVTLPFAEVHIDREQSGERKYLRKQRERKQDIEKEEARRARWGGPVGLAEDVSHVIGKIDRLINSFVFKLTAAWVVADLAFLGSINYVFSTIFGVSLWVWPLGVGWIALGILGALIIIAAFPGGRGWHN